MLKTVLLVLASGACIIFASVEGVLFLNQRYAPKFEAVNREVFLNSPSQVMGNIQELRQMQFEYIKASPESKAALASVILHRTNGLDTNKLPGDLYQFVQSLRNPYILNSGSSNY